MGTVDIDAIVARLHKLEEENSRLKTLLSKHGISYEESKQEPTPVVSKSENKDSAMQRLSLQEKVKLFRSIFKGREDVFAKRWYSDVTKKSGYQPVCEREWNSEFCDKGKYKCTECPNRLFASLTDEHIYNHLAGKDNFGRDVVGVYPIMSGNTCNFLCTDFDDKSCEHGFQNDVLVRKDGHQPIIFMQCGKIRFTADAQSQMNNQSFSRILIPRFTTFRNISSDDKIYTRVVETISKDEVRNRLIIDDVHKAIVEGRTPIVLTSLTSHVRVLADMLLPYSDNVITLVGADSAKEKRRAMERLQNIPLTESLVIVATGKYIGEGFDYPRLDTLFLVLPISWKGNIAQYAGRLHRDCNGKSETRIYDYVDIRVPLCDSMYRKRLKGYASVGYGTIFTSDKAEISKHELIFDGNTYKSVFHQDLIGIKQSLVISCQRIKYKYPPRLISQLRDLLHNGIEIAIHIKERGYNEEDLSNSGFDIIHREDLSIQCAVIDKSIVWYGNVNFFGYNNEDNNVMRICDASIASELLNVIYEDNLL